MDEVWIIIDRIFREIIAFSSEEKIMQYFRELFPEKKSLRLMHYDDNTYSLVNHNSHVFPFAHKIYRMDVDTGEESRIWF